MRKLALVLLTATLLVAPLGACSSQTTTRTVERTSEDGRIEETTVTETREDDDDDGPTGVLSTTINAIGFVLALPFKLVGGLIEIIF